MAGDWIKMNKSLPRDPRVVRISSALKADRLRTVGGLLSAWCLFDEQTEDGKLEGYTPELMDEIVGLSGLAVAMESVGWLEIGDGFLAVPRFEEHNGQSAKRRAQDSVRKMSARKADKCPHEKRTKSGPEKRREEYNTPLPPEGERDGAGDSLRDSMPTAAAAEMHAIMARINELHPSWKKRPTFTRSEMELLMSNARLFAEMTEPDWRLLKSYMHAVIPDSFRNGNPRDFWQPDHRRGLIEHISSVLSNADRWATELRKRKIPMPELETTN